MPTLTDDEIRALLELEAHVMGNECGDSFGCDADDQLEAEAARLLRPLCEEVLRLRAEVARLKDEDSLVSDYDALRADLARHRAVERFACFELRRDRGDVIWNGVLKCLNDAAEGRWSDVPPEALAGAKERTEGE